jgi:hypothetical protein
MKKQSEQQKFQKKNIERAIRSLILLGKAEVASILDQYKSSKDDSSQTVHIHLHDDPMSKIISALKLSVVNDDRETDTKSFR